jgi:dUTPase
MLLQDEIEGRIASGEIRVSYAFDVSQKLPTRLEPAENVDPANQNSLATKAFRSGFFGDRLAIRLGPIVSSHTRKRMKGRVNFNNLSGVFDLRETNGAIRILPNEGMTVSSIEGISLGRHTAAIILPRLSLATAGITLATTYIDPVWDGILQLYLKNTTPNPYELRLGERIAVCRFYSVIGDGGSRVTPEEFAHKSHHYALNWAKILDSDHDPQPLRKRPVAELRRQRITRLTLIWLQQNWAILLGSGVIVALAGLLIGYGRVAERLKHFDDVEKGVKNIQQDVTALSTDVKQMRSRLVSTGEIDTVVPANTPRFSVEIPLDRAWNPADSVWLAIVEGDTSVGLQHALVRDPTHPETSILQISIQPSHKQPTPLHLRLRWLVGSR